MQWRKRFSVTAGLWLIAALLLVVLIAAKL
jgi:hypothetical protein